MVIKELSVYKRLVFNTLLFAIGNFSSKAINFLLLPVYTRVLTPADYGRLDLLSTTVSLLFPFVTFQIFDALFRFTSELKSTESRTVIFSSALIFSVVMSLILIPFYPLFARNKVFSGVVLYFYLSLFLSILQVGVKQYLRASGRVSLFAISDILYSLSLAGFNILFLVIFRQGIDGYLRSTILAQVLTLLFLFLRAELYRELKLCFDVETIKYMLRYSIPLVPNSIMWWVVNVSDRYVLTYFLGIESTGYYSVSARFPALLMMMYSVFFQAWQISAVEEFGKDSYSEVFKKTFEVVSAGMFTLASVLLLVLRPVVRLLVSEVYYPSWRFVPFLLLGVVYQSFSSFYGVNYIASKKTAGVFSTSVVAALVNFGVNIALVKRLGIQAASFSTYLAYLVMWLLRVRESSKVAGVTINLQKAFLSSVFVLFQTFLVLRFYNQVVCLLFSLPITIGILVIYKSDYAKLVKFILKRSEQRL
uniref:Polysaccharide biosynthesis protein n=1 Tax=Fervidobacterium thailandense TaxID=1008305 RepID=A0A7C4VTJ2_9BACT